MSNAILLAQQGWGAISGRIKTAGAVGACSAVAISVTAGSKPIAIRTIVPGVNTPGFNGLPARLLVINGQPPADLYSILKSDITDNFYAANGSALITTPVLFDRLIPAANYNNSQSGGFTISDVVYTFPDGCGPSVGIGETITVILGLVVTGTGVVPANNPWYSLNVYGGEASHFSPSDGGDVRARALPASFGGMR